MSYHQVVNMHQSGVSEEHIAILTSIPETQVRRFIRNAELESRMVGDGYQRFIDREEALKKRGKVLETGTAMKAVFHLIKPLSKAVAKMIDSLNGRPKKILKQMDPFVLALHAIRQIIKGDSQDGFTLASTASVDLIQNIDPTINSTEAMRYGFLIFKAINEATDLIELKLCWRGDRSYYAIKRTDQLVEWEESNRKALAELHTINRPMVIPPRPWGGLYDGGYYNLKLAQPFLRNHRNLKYRHYSPKAIPKIYQAVNKIQATPFVINEFVLSTAEALEDTARFKKFLQEIPEKPLSRTMKQIREKMQVNMSDLKISREDFDAWRAELPRKEAKRARYGKWVRMHLASLRESHEGMIEEIEADRHDIVTLYRWRKQRDSIRSKNSVILTALEMAKEYRHFDSFYFPANCDWRGRIYPLTSGLTTQGTDFQKALIKFAKGKPIGTPEALKFLKIHIANCFGHDKEPLAFKVKWADENHGLFQRITEDPIGSLEDWKNTDEPWLFLAACQAYTQYLNHGLSAVIDIPIPLDGSCNGCQHYSAMTRDPKGAAGVNVIPNGTIGLKERLTEIRRKLE